LANKTRKEADATGKKRGESNAAAQDRELIKRKEEEGRAEEKAVPPWVTRPSKGK